MKSTIQNNFLPRKYLITMSTSNFWKENVLFPIGEDRDENSDADRDIHMVKENIRRQINNSKCKYDPFFCNNRESKSYNCERNIFVELEYKKVKAKLFSSGGYYQGVNFDYYIEYTDSEGDETDEPTKTQKLIGERLGRYIKKIYKKAALQEYKVAYQFSN